MGYLSVFYILLWAAAYVPSKVAAVEAPPLWFLVARFLVAGAKSISSTPAQARARSTSEQALWKEMVRISGAKAE